MSQHYTGSEKLFVSLKQCTMTWNSQAKVQYANTEEILLVICIQYNIALEEWMCQWASGTNNWQHWERSITNLYIKLISCVLLDARIVSIELEKFIRQKVNLYSLCSCIDICVTVSAVTYVSTVCMYILGSLHCSTTLCANDWLQLAVSYSIIGY